MAFKKGEPRPENSGRKPGSKNKRSSVLEICQGLGLDPFVEMAKIAQDVRHKYRFDALKELCQYIEPKKKHTDVSVDPENSTIRVEIVDYVQKK